MKNDNTLNFANDCIVEAKKKLYTRKYDDAVLLTQRAIQIFLKFNDLESYAFALNLMGVIYGAIGNETMSIDCLLKGLECATEHHFTTITNLFYNNIGSRYQDLNDHETALPYFLEAEKQFEDEDCQRSERFHLWYTITCLNTFTSYTAIHNYALAEEYLKKAERFINEPDIAWDTKYSIILAKCSLYYHTGQIDYVKKQLPYLVEQMEDNSVSDYLQNLNVLFDLLSEMKEYEYMEVILRMYEKYVMEQNSLSLKVNVMEKWLNFYQQTGNIEKYEKACIRYTTLSMELKLEEKKELSHALSIRIQLQEKEAAFKKAELHSKTDSLTGINNRYALKNDFSELMKENTNHNQMICLGIIDVDHFKNHNDTYGHLRGDECLKSIASILSKECNSSGNVYRFGGDEFILLLKVDDVSEVEDIAKSIKNALYLENETFVEKADHQLTVSQGYYCFMADSNYQMEEALNEADHNLYSIKNKNRNDFKITQAAFHS